LADKVGDVPQRPGPLRISCFNVSGGQSGEFARESAFVNLSFTGMGVVKFQLPRVETESIQRVALRPVLRITGDGVAQVCHVNAYLVAAPCAEF
jgi:hypothetical protein